MAVTLVVLGLLMNIVGVLMSSSRDLSALGRSVGQTASLQWRRIAFKVRAMWTRLRGGRTESQVREVSASDHVTLGTHEWASVWKSVSDDLEPVEAIRLLCDRTDTLHAMLEDERNQRAEAVTQLSGQASQIDHKLDAGLEQLHTRIDDFAVKPAGQRAMGAVLVVCGSGLMFAGGLMGH